MYIAVDASDASLLDILNGLADENIESSTVDDNSPLGSQCVDSDIPLSSDLGEDEKEEDGNVDLNLTLLQLDSLSWSQPKGSSQVSTNSGLPSNLSVFDLDTDENSDASISENIVPQCDGAGDLSSEDSDHEADMTLERQEKRICDYRCHLANREKVVNVVGPSHKRYCQEAVDPISKTPEKCERSHSVRTPASVCNSPKSGVKSRPSRSYSPLSIIFKSPRKMRENRNANLSPIIDGDTSVEQAKLALPHESMRRTNVTEINENDYSLSSEMDSCNVTFTQYLDTQLKRNADSISRSESFCNSMAGCGKEIVILPKFNPPNIHKVSETLETYGIPAFRNENPFFGNHMDATNRKEVAHKFLQVPSKSLFDLPLFKSDLNASTGIRLWRAMKMKEVYPSGASIERSKMRQRLSGQNKIVIAPLAEAPSRKKVKTWCRAREHLKNLAAIKEPSCSKSIENPQRHPKLPESTNSKRGMGDTAVLTDSSSSCTANLTGMDASLESALQNSNLYKEGELSRQLGISCGQIEGSSQVDPFKIPCANLQDIKPLAHVSIENYTCIT